MEAKEQKQLNPYHNVKLDSSIDFKFLATQVGEKLKNPNYKAEWRVTFLKALFEELKPLLTQGGLERIEKTVPMSDNVGPRSLLPKARGRESRASKSHRRSEH